MMLGFLIWSAGAAVFFLIGVSNWKADEAAGFFTFTKPPVVKEVKKYNHAVAKIWFVAAALFEIAGVPLLFLEQNSPLIFLTAGAVVILVIAMMIVYLRVEERYKA